MYSMRRHRGTRAKAKETTALHGESARTGTSTELEGAQRPLHCAEGDDLLTQRGLPLLEATHHTGDGLGHVRLPARHPPHLLLALCDQLEVVVGLRAGGGQWHCAAGSA